AGQIFVQHRPDIGGRTGAIGIWAAGSPLGQASRVSLLPDWNASHRPNYLLSADGGLATLGRSSPVRVFDTGHPCRLRRLLSRVIPNTPARHWSRDLLQWRPTGRRGRVVLSRLAQEATRHRPASGGDIAQWPVLHRHRSGVLAAGDPRTTAAR